MKIEHDRGYLILAQNNQSVDYLQCARTLAKSIHYHMPGSKVCLLTDKLIEDDCFDIVKIFPHGDRAQDVEWKLLNDWQCFYGSPFRQTIKIEADMLITGDISHWWTGLSQRDLVLTIGAKDFRNRTASSRYYRQIFDDNNLPDVYNAITYWRLSNTAHMFFNHVKAIFETWDSVMGVLKFGTNQSINTDLAYAIAAQMIGIENCTLPTLDYPSLIHMKQYINGNVGDDWTKEMVYEITDCCTRINTVAAEWPLHYQIKKFAGVAEPIYDKLLASIRAD